MPANFSTSVEKVEKSLNSKEKIPCPDCGQPYLPAGMALHRSIKHGKTKKAKKNTPLKEKSLVRKEPPANGNHGLIPHTLFLSGYITATIERGHEVSYSALTQGVGEYLRSQTGR